MFIKKWWMNIIYTDKNNRKIILIAWLNTLHDCEDKNLIPKKITGSMHLIINEFGNKSIALIDNSIIKSEEWQKSEPKYSYGETQNKKYVILESSKYAYPDINSIEKLEDELEWGLLGNIDIDNLRIEDFIVESYIDIDNL